MRLKLKALNFAVAAVVAGASAVSLTYSQQSLAANNPLSRVSVVEKVDGKSVQYFDLTLNVDWDYDNAADPKRIQLGTGANRGAGRPEVVLNRDYIIDLVNQTARTLFVMTNGHHRLGNVYVFKNGKFGQNVDIRVLNVPGRANASAPGWMSDGGLTTNNYITNCNAQNAPDGECPVGQGQTDLDVLDPENFVQTGEVIAHELGHYLYALFDEYVDGKDCDPEAPASPCKDDIERPTAMNNQAKAYRISTLDDYPSRDFSKTAHGRAYGESAWQTLIKDPAQDNATAKESHGNRRIRFDAFTGLSVPAINDLKNFTDSDDANSSPAGGRDVRLARQTGNGADVATFTGYDTKLKLVFEGVDGQVDAVAKPRNVLVIDRTLPTATFNEAITAAKGLVDRASENSRFAIVTMPAQQGADLGFTNSMDTNSKTAVKNALNMLTRVDGSADLQAAYTAAKDFVTGARPKTGTENAANTDTLTLLTLNTTTVPSGLGATARGDKIAFNVLGFKAPATAAAAPAPAPAQNLQTLASASGGSNNTVKSANEAIKEGDSALKEAAGESEALMAADLSDDPFVASAPLTTEFDVNTAVDGNVEVRWYFTTADTGKLTFNCAGSAVTTSSLSDEESMASCTITSSGAKTVTATTTGNANAVEVEVVSKPAGAAVELSAMIDGGTLETNRPPVLMAKLAGSTPITGAIIKVLIFDADSTSDQPVIPEITLNASHDAGNNGDNRANDGIYTLNLAGRLAAGNYVVIAEATTDANSKFSSQGVINAGPQVVNGVKIVPGTKEVGDPIQRLSEGEFTLDAGAPGLATTKKGGGCTVGGGTDAGLLALLSLAGLGLMRRRFTAKGRRAA